MGRRGTRSRCQESLGLSRWPAGVSERREHCASRRDLSSGKTLLSRVGQPIEHRRPGSGRSGTAGKRENCMSPDFSRRDRQGRKGRQNSIFPFAGPGQNFLSGPPGLPAEIPTSLGVLRVLGERTAMFGMSRRACRPGEELRMRTGIVLTMGSFACSVRHGQGAH